MDRIDDLLVDSAKKPLAAAVKHALTFAQKVINKYYSRTDMSNIYHIAMGEHLYFSLFVLMADSWHL